MYVGTTVVCAFLLKQQPAFFDSLVSLITQSKSTIMEQNLEAGNQHATDDLEENQPLFFIDNKGDDTMKSVMQENIDTQENALQQEISDLIISYSKGNEGIGRTDEVDAFNALDAIQEDEENDAIHEHEDEE